MTTDADMNLKLANLIQISNTEDSYSVHNVYGTLGSPEDVTT